MLNGHVWLVTTLLSRNCTEYGHCDKVPRDRATIGTEMKSSESTTASPVASTAASSKAATQLLGRLSLPRHWAIRELAEPTRWGPLHVRALTNRAGSTARAENDDQSG